MLGLSPGTGVPAARNCRTDVTNNAAAAATSTAPSGAIPDGRKCSGQTIWSVDPTRIAAKYTKGGRTRPAFATSGASCTAGMAQSRPVTEREARSTGRTARQNCFKRSYSPVGTPGQLPGAPFRRVSAAAGTDSHLEQHVEAAVDQPLAVERHRVDVGTHAGVSHHLLHALVTHLARRPGDPREDDRLVLLALHCQRKGRQLALRYVVAPALDHLHCAVLLEDDRGGLGMLLVHVAIGRGNGRDESIDVTHRDSLLSDRFEKPSNAWMLSSRRSREAPVDNARQISRKKRRRQPQAAHFVKRTA